MPKLSPFLVIAAVVFPFATGSLWAQGPAVIPMPAPYEAELPGLGHQEALQVQPMTDVLTDREYRSSHWQEGLVLGAVLGGVFGGLLGHGLCGFDDARSGSCVGSAIKGALLLAAPGGALGALVGGLFPKPVPEDEEDYSAPNASM